MNEKNYTENLFYFIPLTVILTMFLSWETSIYYSPDSYLYIKMAESFPKIETSIFPFFYPFTLKVVNYLINNFDITAKLLNILSVTFVFVFVKRKNFFWKEIWTMMTFSSFLNIFPFVWSEVFLLPFLVVYAHINFLVINNRNDKCVILQNGIIMAVLCMIKYNSLFLVIGTAVFAILLKKKKRIFLVYLQSLVITGFIITLYLVFNYYQFGTATGKRHELQSMNYGQFLYFSIINILPSLDPFFNSLYAILKKLRTITNVRSLTFLPYIISYLIIFMFVIKK